MQLDRRRRQDETEAESAPQGEGDEDGLELGRAADVAGRAGRGSGGAFERIQGGDTEYTYVLGSIA